MFFVFTELIKPILSFQQKKTVSQKNYRKIYEVEKIISIHAACQTEHVADKYFHDVFWSQNRNRPKGIRRQFVATFPVAVFLTNAHESCFIYSVLC